MRTFSTDFTTCLAASDVKIGFYIKLYFKDETLYLSDHPLVTIDSVTCTSAVISFGSISESADQDATNTSFSVYPKDWKEVVFANTEQLGFLGRKFILSSDRIKAELYCAARSDIATDADELLEALYAVKPFSANIGDGTITVNFSTIDQFLDRKIGALNGNKYLPFHFSWTAYDDGNLYDNGLYIKKVIELQPVHGECTIAHTVEDWDNDYDLKCDRDLVQAGFPNSGTLLLNYQFYINYFGIDGNRFLYTYTGGTNKVIAGSSVSLVGGTFKFYATTWNDYISTLDFRSLKLWPNKIFEDADLPIPEWTVSPYIPSFSEYKGGWCMTLAEPLWLETNITDEGFDNTSYSGGSHIIDKSLAITDQTIDIFKIGSNTLTIDEDEEWSGTGIEYTNVPETGVFTSTIRFPLQKVILPDYDFIQIKTRYKIKIAIINNDLLSLDTIRLQADVRMGSYHSSIYITTVQPDEFKTIDISGAKIYNAITFDNYASDWDNYFYIEFTVTDTTDEENEYQLDIALIDTAEMIIEYTYNREGFPNYQIGRMFLRMDTTAITPSDAFKYILSDSVDGGDSMIDTTSFNDAHNYYVNNNFYVEGSAEGSKSVRTMLNNMCRHGCGYVNNVGGKYQWTIITDTTTPLIEHDSDDSKLGSTTISSLDSDFDLNQTTMTYAKVMFGEYDGDTEVITRSVETEDGVVKNADIDIENTWYKEFAEWVGDTILNWNSANKLLLKYSYDFLDSLSYCVGDTIVFKTNWCDLNTITGRIVNIERNYNDCSMVNLEVIGTWVNTTGIFEIFSDYQSFRENITIPNISVSVEEDYNAISDTLTSGQFTMNQDYIAVYDDSITSGQFTINQNYVAVYDTSVIFDENKFFNKDWFASPFYLY